VKTRAPCRSLVPVILREVLDKRTILLGAAGTVSLAVLVFMPQLFRDQIGEAFVALEGASAGWLWLAAAAFLAALICSASAWRAATKLPDRFDAYARYGVRLALFAKAAPDDHRLRTAAKALASVAVVRLGCVGILLLATLKPVVILGLLVAPLLGRVPSWVVAATLARVAAAAAVAASMGVPAPLLTALLVVPAIDLAGLFAFTPGNIGVKTGAIAIALQAQGVDATTALSTGIAFHAVETLVGLTFGSAATLYLSRVPIPRWAVAGATTVVAAAFVGSMVIVH
jgi:hypothetical protein